MRLKEDGSVKKGLQTVTPAKAGVQNYLKSLDSLFHGNDKEGRFPTFHDSIKEGSRPRAGERGLRRPQCLPRPVLRKDPDKAPASAADRFQEMNGHPALSGQALGKDLPDREPLDLALHYCNFAV